MRLFVSYTRFPSLPKQAGATFLRFIGNPGDAEALLPEGIPRALRREHQTFFGNRTAVLLVPGKSLIFKCLLLKLEI
jgi:hypothetical protein